MKKSSSFKILFFALVILIGIYALAFFYGERLLQHTKNPGKAEKKSEIVNTTVENKVCFPYRHQGNPCFKVQIADTDEKRRKGLMFVEQLPEDEGMLFTYDQEGSYTFWMKNTLIPLDMIWINKNKKIVDIQTAQPCKTEECPVYTPKGKAQYVLELNAEITKKYGIQIGQKLALTQIITNTFNTVPDQKNVFSGWIKFSKQYSDYTWRDGEAEGMCAFMIDIAARELEGVVEGWEKKNHFVIENEVSNDCTVEGYYSDDGKRQGTWISYYPNGKMHKKSQYKNNKRSGLQQEWYPNGNMRTIPIGTREY
ncbi:MAG: hypothetical protein CR971_03000 [candidate division SR1 bacterium]|nr:MAG: hypothetical protein CR971_03000 [candidate division SR1 bacterium]